MAQRLQRMGLPHTLAASHSRRTALAGGQNAGHIELNHLIFLMPAKARRFTRLCRREPCPEEARRHPSADGDSECCWRRAGKSHFHREYLPHGVEVQFFNARHAVIAVSGSKRMSVVDYVILAGFGRLDNGMMPCACPYSRVGFQYGANPSERPER